MPEIKFSFIKSFLFQYFATITILMFAFFSLSNFFRYQADHHNLEHHFAEITTTLATTLVPHIPAEKLLQLSNGTPPTDQNFQDIRSILQQAQTANGFSEDQIYILQKDKNKENIYYFLVMLQEKTFIGDPYSPPRKVQDYYYQAAKGESQQIPLFSDENGSFISALAPIKDADGETIAILEVDRNIQEFSKEIGQRIINEILIETLLFALLALFGYSVYRRLQNQIIKLLDATDAIQLQDYTHYVDIETDDEFGKLAEALNTSISALNERFMMLKFIPPHTKRLIETAMNQNLSIDLNTTKLVSVIVMETDIRGFTKLSETLSPRQTIELINKFIEAQANIIIKHGGSIDKYMGDAVLVIFEDALVSPEGYPSKESRAVDAAFEIQQAVEDLNKTQPENQKVHIGIGLSIGEVVFGNMGCSDRMEYTVIGSTVNLAARLCSEAKAGEIVIQKTIPEGAGRLVREEFVDVKGFSEPIAVLRYTKEQVQTGTTIWWRK